ncbi:MAG: hypothetical protein HQL30_06535 [Candidatus Omnitrophica bacterium]|nr:hypothetical protein [Candidatus Omnitrophota bacterium]
MKMLSAKKRTLRSISLIVIFFFVSGLLANDVFAGFNSPLAPQSMFNQMDKFTQADEGVNAIKDTFQLPVYLGEVRETHKGNSDLFVIHIQDAHCNKEAQKKISEIIGYFNKEHGVKIVNLEGGSGAYDTGVFDAINDPKAKKTISDYFVDKGELNGAESFAVNNPGKVELWGIEKKDYYMENLKVYRDSMPKRNDVNGALGALESIYSQLKKKIFSENLAKIDGYFTAYKAGNMDFRDYVDALGKTAKAEGIDLKWFFNVFLLFQVTEMESDIDFRKADNERDTLMEELEKGLSIKEKEKLIAKSVAFKNKLIPEKQFYSFLLEKARYLEIDKTKFPTLFKYIVYVSIYEGIDYANLMTELDDLEIELKSKYFRNEDERALDRLSMDLAMLKNIFNVTLTKRDHEYYLANKASFSAENFLKFAKDNAAKYGIEADLPASINELDGYRQKMEGFFECSFKRDASFMENLKFPGESVEIARSAKEGEAGGEEDNNSPRSAVLVTGGFHTDNMKALLKKNKISFISIIPKFRNGDGYESPYFKLLGGENPAFEEKLKGLVPQSSMIAIATKLCASGDADAPLGELVHGAKDLGAFRLAVGILEALIREKIADPEWITANIDRADIKWSKERNQITVKMPDKKAVTIDISEKRVGRESAQKETAHPIGPVKRAPVLTGKGGLIGKLFVKIDSGGFRQVRDGIIAVEEEEDGKKWLKFYIENEYDEFSLKSELYTKDGVSARFEITGECTLPGGGKAKTIENNLFVMGYGSAKGIYITKKMRLDPLALFHEGAEGYYNGPKGEAVPDMIKALGITELPELPVGVNPHTFLRGCGKDMKRIALNSKKINIETAHKNVDAFIRELTAELMGMDPLRVNPSELALIRYNVARGITGKDLLAGLQEDAAYFRQFGLDGVFNGEANERLSGRLALPVWNATDVKKIGGNIEPLSGDADIYPIPDVHGDLKALRAYLAGLGLIYPRDDDDPLQDEWVGGDKTAVQLGDAVDRGKDSLLVFKYLRKMQEKARDQGGEVVRLLGNHELMYLSYASAQTDSMTRGDSVSYRERMKEYEHYWNDDLAGGKKFDADGYSLNEETGARSFLEMLKEDIIEGRVKAGHYGWGKIFTHGIVTEKVFNAVKEAAKIGLSPDEASALELSPEKFVELANEELMNSVMLDDFSASEGLLPAKEGPRKTSASAIFSNTTELCGIFTAYISDFDDDGTPLNDGVRIGKVYTASGQVVGHDALVGMYSIMNGRVLSVDVRMSEAFENGGVKKAVFFSGGKVYLARPNGELIAEKIRKKTGSDPGRFNSLILKETEVIVADRDIDRSALESWLNIFRRAAELSTGKQAESLSMMCIVAGLSALIRGGYDNYFQSDSFDAMYRELTLREKAVAYALTLENVSPVDTRDYILKYLPGAERILDRHRGNDDIDTTAGIEKISERISAAEAEAANRGMNYDEKAEYEFIRNILAGYGKQTRLDNTAKERTESTREALKYMDPNCMDWIVTPMSLETEAGKEGIDREAARKMKKDYGSNTKVLDYEYGPEIAPEDLARNIAIASAEALGQMAGHVGTEGKPRAMVYIPKSVDPDDIRSAIRLAYIDEADDAFDALRVAFRGSMSEILLAYGGKAVSGKGTPAEFEANLLMAMMKDISYVREGNIPDNAVIDEVNHVIAAKLLLDRARKKSENKYKSDQEATLIRMLNVFLSGVFDPDGTQVDKLAPDILDMIMAGMYVINMVQPVDYEDIREVWEAQSEVLRSL